VDNQWKKDELTFVDSWKDKSIELAATSALIVGGGMLVAKGHAPDAIKYGKKTLKEAQKGFDRYVNKKLNPSAKFVYGTGKKMWRDFKGLPKIDPKRNFDDKVNDYQAAQSEIAQQDVGMLARKRMSESFGKYKHEMKVKQELDPHFVVPAYIEPSAVEVEERIMQEMIEKEQRKKLGTLTPDGFKQKKPWITKEEFAQNAIASSVGGLAFGGGVTLFHSLDEKIKTDKKNSNRSFEAAGSYLKKDNKRKSEGGYMKKHAGVRELHDSLAGAGSKFPQAVASGLGFTGVSVGTAQVLKKKKEEEAKAKDQNRIIIEFGANDVAGRGDGDHMQAGGYGLIPRANVEKLATVNRFLQNLGGRKAEVSELDKRMTNFDYHQGAAESLKGKNVEDMAQNQYGHLFSDADKAKEKLFEGTAKQLKQDDFNKQEGIKNEVARDRMYTLGGLGLAGLGAAGVNQLRKEDTHG
jgi:hypothetical protein